jgi:hypothetical protein
MNSSMDSSNAIPPGDVIVDAVVDEKSSATVVPPPESPKAQDIRDACQNLDIKALVLLATSDGGLLDDNLRKTAWPILLGSSDQAYDSGDWKSLPIHKDEEQVALDVNRSFVYYPNGKFAVSP